LHPHSSFPDCADIKDGTTAVFKGRGYVVSDKQINWQESNFLIMFSFFSLYCDIN
jgi:hypothetical protein